MAIAYSIFDWSDEEEIVSCYQAMQRTLYEKAFFKELPVELYTKNTVGLYSVGSEEPKLAFTKNVDDEFLNTVADALLCPNESKS